MLGLPQKRVKLVVDAFGKGDPCEDLERWHELVNDKSVKMWVWDFAGNQASVAVKSCSALNMVQRLKKQHVAKHRRMKKGPFENVAIQGAGPTGLLGALELYAAGSKVRVFEKRAKDYERKQILRLDPRWHAALQCFLASDFETLVSSGKAQVNDDKTIEIPARNLEIVLKDRLLKQNADDPLNSAFHYGELSGINERRGTVQCEGCDAKEYVASQLILAGGGSNPLRDKLLGIPKVRTPQKPYEVAAFDKSGYSKLQQCNWARNFRESVSPSDVRHIVYEICRDKNFEKSEHCSFMSFENSIEARQFETGDVLYFGVELPEIALRLFAECQAMQADSSKTCVRQLANAFASSAVKSLTNPACHSGLKLAAAQMFDLSQSALEVFAQVIGGRIAITAAGDSLVTPHFFSGSGLSSARKGIEDLRDLAKEATFDNYEKEVSAKAEKTVEFTLNRGLPYYN